jgi:PAS domain S-box-containing protein
MVKAQGPEDIIGKDILAFICPEDQAQTLDSVSRIAGDRVTFPRQEKHIIAVDGEVLTVEIAAKPVNFQGLPSIMVLMRDISEQKKTEDALFDSRQMLQTVLDTIPQRVFWKDKNSVFLGCNKANARDAGFADPAQMVGKSDYDYTSTEVAELYRADDRRVMETGQGRINYEEPQARPDGGRAWLRTSKVPLRDKKGTVVGVLGTYEDITEYKQSQEALRESEEKYRLLVETTSDFIWEVDTEGKYTYISPKIRDILGFDPEEIIGKTPFDLMTSYDTSRIAAEFLDYVKKEEPFSGLVNANHHKDGSTVIIETSAAPFFDRNGAFAGYRGIDRDITKRTKIEEALRESEEKYRTLVENASEVIAIVQDWKIVFVNRQGAQLIGKTPAELTGRLFMDFIWPEDRARLNEIHGTWVTGGPAPETYDFRIIGAGEKPVWVSNSITAISWEGKPAALSLMTNITERKVAEAALQESEATFRSVIEGAPEAIYIGADWNFQYLNPAALRLFGASSGEQLIGTPFMDRIHPKFHDVIRERVVGLYDERVAAPPLEEVYLKLDGSEIEVEVSSVPFRYKGNDGALVFIWDITDRKKAEQARLESEAEYRRILDTMQDAYIRADTVGKIITVNPSAARMFGYASPGEMRGIPVSALYSHPAKRQEIVTRLEREGMVADAVELLLRMDSTTFWASINVQALRGEDGQLVGTEGIIRDITERKALEQAIEDTNKKLSLLNSITRHDVANQLTALRGYAQLAELSNPDPVVLDFLQKIETATDTIAGQIEFTKAYQELGEKTPAWFRIDAIVEKTARDGVTFSNTCRAIEIFADPMIERVFYNLFDNAIRHGDHVTTIGVRCERAPDGLVIYVEDDGIGVVPEEKEKIFEKGFGKNTGFGLFLAREILATTGITIRETGYVGVGARFEITVPREMWRIFPGG